MTTSENSAQTKNSRCRRPPCSSNTATTKPRLATSPPSAGVSKGAIYLHFDSKDALLEALFLHETQRIQKWGELLEADPDGGRIGPMYKEHSHRSWTAHSCQPYSVRTTGSSEPICANQTTSFKNAVGTDGTTTLPLCHDDAGSRHHSPELDPCRRRAHYDHVIVQPDRHWRYPAAALYSTVR